MRIHPVRLGAAALLVTAVTGCAATGPSGPDPADGRIAVVASTNVWGDVAATVGGAEVAVTSLVSTGDPHSYQVTARDAATLREAALIVSNGGGYDDFVAQALGDDAEQPLVVAFDVHSGPAPASPTEGEGDGHGHAAGENEHVWYDLHTVGAVAGEIATRLGELRPAARDTFAANAAAFQERLEGLEARVDAIAAQHPGAPVAATEPIAFHLLAEAGLTDVTPIGFVAAVEEGDDPPAAAVADIQRVVGAREVAVLVHNPQTETPVVTELIGQARDTGVPVVDMTETLPDGQDYLTWMGDQIGALTQALASTTTR